LTAYPGALWDSLVAGITLEIAETNLSKWIAADEALASGVAMYEIDVGGSRRKLTRVNAEEITKKIDYWMKWVNRLSSGRTGGPRFRSVIVHDL
jgi:hypothetical protein